MQDTTKDGVPLARDKQSALDAILMKLEPALTREQGLPRRPWYKHFVYAPGYYTGYSVKTLPGVREAIEERYWSEANEQIGLAAQILDHFTDELDQATALLDLNRRP
jgi:N-acetylated-alpha-linked acidic dipeptidase